MTTKSTALRDWQIQFFEAMISKTANAPSFIRESNAFSQKERFEVYRRAYAARLKTSLQEDFNLSSKLIELYLSKKDVTQIWEEYLTRFRSTSYTLADYGRNFPQFLRFHPKLKSIPLLYDLAQLEWSLVLSFYTPPKLWSSEDWQNVLQSGEIENSLICLSPSVREVSVNYPVHHFLEPGDFSETAKSMKPQYGIIITFTQDRPLKSAKISCLSLNNEENIIFEALKEPTTISSLSAKLEKYDTVTPEMLQKTFQLWVSKGILDGCYEASSEKRKVKE